jgi:hypothetical protein
MQQYLVAIHHPDNYDRSLEDQAIPREIGALNEEMVAAGVRIFVRGLSPASNATSLRAQPDGEVLITDGPYLETKEHVDDFGCRKPLTSTRRWRGDARPPYPVGRRSRCECFSGRGRKEVTERHGHPADRSDLSSVCGRTAAEDVLSEVHVGYG